VAELSTARLGGARQSLLIRGDHVSNPVVLFLHGGPGMPSMYLAHDFQPALEPDFTVVQWDRRGAGRSYDARFPAESLTVRRTLDDLYELTALLRDRFHTRRLYLVAHSWGTYLGLQAIHEHPEWYVAYVGMGQMTPDASASRRARRACVLDAAQSLHNPALYARLARRYRSDSAPIRESDEFVVHGELYRSSTMWPLVRSGLGAPEYTWADALHLARGAAFVNAHMVDNVASGWMRGRPRVDVPVAMFLGRHDCNEPSDLAARFLDSMVAPVKRLVWFEASAHFPFWEEPEKFARELRSFDSLLVRAGRR